MHNGRFLKSLWNSDVKQGNWELDSNPTQKGKVEREKTWKPIEKKGRKKTKVRELSLKNSENLKGWGWGLGAL